MKQDFEPISHSKTFEEQLRILLWERDVGRQLTKLCEMANKPDAYGDEAPTIQKLARWLEQLIKDQAKGKVRERTLNLLNNALCPYYNNIPARTWIDKEGLHTQLMHPERIQPEALIAFLLGASIRSGMWRRVRRCKYDKCNEFFFDAKKRGRRDKKYCSTNHGAYARKPKER